MRKVGGKREEKKGGSFAGVNKIIVDIWLGRRRVEDHGLAWVLQAKEMDSWLAIRKRVWSGLRGVWRSLIKALRKGGLMGAYGFFSSLITVFSASLSAKISLRSR